MKNGRISNVVQNNQETGSFCGIWDDWAVNSVMTMILKTFGLWCLKKIQNFFDFYEFFSKTWYKKGKKSGIFQKKTRIFLELQLSGIFWEFFKVTHCRMGKNYPKRKKKIIFRMPSFCPILESSIKVMHRRKANNDQKFTKICFSRDLSLKSGKLNFHEFWIIFGHSTMHHFSGGLQFRAKWRHS